MLFITDTVNKKAIYIAAGAGALLLLLPALTGAETANTPAGAGQLSAQGAVQAAANFLPTVEGFSSTPYWDVNRYSWGYGTAAPGASGTITRDQALSDSVAVLQQDYYDLAYQLTRPLSAGQWSALLSFSYNLGVGAAYDILDTINAGDDTALQAQWMQYVHAAGVVSQDLVQRRQKEWQLWQT